MTDDFARRPRHVLFAAAVAAFFVLLGVTGSSSALAQEVTCEQVPYNGRIVIKCASRDDGDSPSPTPTPTPTSEAVDDDDESDASANNDDDESGDSDDSDDGDESDDAGPVFGFDDGSGRGDRGDREIDEPDEDAEATDTDDDTGDTDAADGQSSNNDSTSDIDQPDSAADSESDAGDNGDDAIDDNTESTLIFDGTPDPAPSNTPIIVATSILAALGAIFFMASARVRQQPDEDFVVDDQ